MLNMFIMVIIQLFDDFYINTDNILNEWKDKENDFQKVWVKFTEETQGAKMH